MATPPFALVTWDDAWADGGDAATVKDVGDKHRPTVMETAGWLLRDDEGGISLFNERYIDEGEETFRSRTFIPRAMIRSVTQVRLSTPRKPRKLKPPPPKEP